MIGISDRKRFTNNSKANALFLINATLASFLVYSLVETFVLRVFYSIIFFLFTYLFQSYLLGPQSTRRAKIPLIPLTRLIPYILGITSLFVTLPPAPKYNVTVSLLAFTSLTPLSVIRVISGYFLLSVFPGYVAYEVFMKNKHLAFLEKVGFVLAMSYALSVILGLSIRLLGFELTTSSLVAAIWLFTIAMKAIEHALLKRKRQRVEAIEYTLSKQKGRLSPSIRLACNPVQISLLVIIFLCVVFSSYFIVFSSEPTDLALTYDVARYVETSNKLILNQPVTADVKYIWLQFFIAEASILTGLQPIYAFVGLQYYVILPLAAFYALLKALLPRNERAPAIAVAVVSLLHSLGAIGMYDFFWWYRKGGRDTWIALNNVYAKTGIGSGPIMFFTAGVDIAMVLLAMAYAFKYLMNQQEKLRNILLISLFFNTAMFSHGIFATFPSVISLILFAIIHKRVRLVMTVILTMLAMFLLLEVLSGFLFTNMFLPIYLYATIFFMTRGTVLQFQFMLKIIFIAFLILSLLYLSLYFLRGELSNSISSLKLKFLERRVIKILFWGIALTITFTAIFAWRADWLNIGIFAMFSDPSYVAPWHIFIIGSYGPSLLITIGCLPMLLRRSDKKPLVYVFTWLISIILVGFAGVLVIPRVPFIPLYVSIATWTYRYFGFIAIPLVCFAAVGLSWLRFELIDTKTAS